MDLFHVNILLAFVTQASILPWFPQLHDLVNFRIILIPFFKHLTRVKPPPKKFYVSFSLWRNEFSFVLNSVFGKLAFQPLAYFCKCLMFRRMAQTAQRKEVAQTDSQARLMEAWLSTSPRKQATNKEEEKLTSNPAEANMSSLTEKKCLPKVIV